MADNAEVQTVETNESKPVSVGSGAGVGVGIGMGAGTDTSGGEEYTADGFEIPVFAKKHIEYVKALQKDTRNIEYAVTEHLRMSGVYWGLAAMELLHAGNRMEVPAIVEWVLRCYHDCGGFGGNEGHDPHMLYTLSAVQILAMANRLDAIDADAVAKYVAGLQQEDGSFAGDQWGEIDTRFSYCALLCLAIIGKLDAVDVASATEYVASCRNFDGGFGCTPGAESHAAQVFCCVGALSIGNALHLLDADLLGWWLCERQCDSGGLNGRPEKQADVCYSWWVASSLAIIGRLDWIDKRKLTDFILKCQDADSGGISERPGNVVDVFHTFFGIGGLSLLGHLDTVGLPHQDIDPAFALPTPLIARLGLTSQRLTPAKHAADVKSTSK